MLFYVCYAKLHYKNYLSKKHLKYTLFLSFMYHVTGEASPLARESEIISIASLFCNCEVSLLLNMVLLNLS